MHRYIYQEARPRGFNNRRLNPLNPVSVDLSLPAKDRPAAEMCARSSFTDMASMASPSAIDAGQGQYGLMVRATRLVRAVLFQHCPFGRACTARSSLSRASPDRS